MKILEIKQGFYDGLTGMPFDEAIKAFEANDALSWSEHPTWSHFRCWHVREVPDDQTAPWGHEWWIADERGLLKMHSAQYDSSG